MNIIRAEIKSQGNMFALMNNVINMKKVEINIRKLSVAFLGRKKQKHPCLHEQSNHFGVKYSFLFVKSHPSLVDGWCWPEVLCVLNQILCRCLISALFFHGCQMPAPCPVVVRKRDIIFIKARARRVLYFMFSHSCDNHKYLAGKYPG